MEAEIPVLPVVWERINDVYRDYVKGHNPADHFGIYDVVRERHVLVGQDLTRPLKRRRKMPRQIGDPPTFVLNDRYAIAARTVVRPLVPQAGHSPTPQLPTCQPLLV
jgi:hypothetical protein